MPVVRTLPGCRSRDRYRLTLGPAQSGLCIKVASQEEAAKRLKTEVEKLRGPEW